MFGLAQKGPASADPAAWESWDWQFHRALCLVTGNRLLLSIFDSFNAIRRQRTWSQLHQAVLTSERREHSAQQHNNILDAISARNALGGIRYAGAFGRRSTQSA
jgi:DNA-binding FadR family transcriptional regulator